MLNTKTVKSLANIYNIPFEDVLFIALNLYGANYNCDFNRMRMGLHVTNKNLFSYAKQRNELDYYFALPINKKSPFSVFNNQLLLDDIAIGEAIEPTEDFCDSNYPRRKGTVLNINPNSRTSCRGCEFCYTAYQVPNDKKKFTDKNDIRLFFLDWMKKNKLSDLSHLIQVAVVTGCYNNNEELCEFILLLEEVLNEYDFHGEIFYLGSQISDEKFLNKVARIRSFGLCLSLECFTRRTDLLRDKKKSLTINKAYELMSIAKQQGIRINFSYIIGLESLEIVKRYFTVLKQHITSFPIINTIQLHKYHSYDLLDQTAHDIEYFLKARKMIEEIFIETTMRPRVWEDYRSLWFLKFGNEELQGIRVP